MKPRAEKGSPAWAGGAAEGTEGKRGRAPVEEPFAAGAELPKSTIEPVGERRSPTGWRERTSLLAEREEEGAIGAAFVSPRKSGNGSTGGTSVDGELLRSRRVISLTGAGGPAALITSSGSWWSLPSGEPEGSIAAWMTTKGSVRGKWFQVSLSLWSFEGSERRRSGGGTTMGLARSGMTGGGSSARLPPPTSFLIAAFAAPGIALSPRAPAEEEGRGGGRSTRAVTADCGRMGTPASFSTGCEMRLKKRSAKPCSDPLLFCFWFFLYLLTAKESWLTIPREWDSSQAIASLSKRPPEGESLWRAASIS
mmetsp:Transcript_7752/g.32655  ORF Transcript_7752/g.32655 Transcript_7752/m.32655 type:complete len:309 (-) Transcript_7752:1223-2149(-)